MKLDKIGVVLLILVGIVLLVFVATDSDETVPQKQIGCDDPAFDHLPPTVANCQKVTIGPNSNFVAYRSTGRCLYWDTDITATIGSQVNEFILNSNAGTQSTLLWTLPLGRYSEYNLIDCVG